MYEPLDPIRREVRLLQLIGGSDDGPIQCSLRTVSLDETDLEFATLSYVWGDESITRDVLVEGHPRAVTANLESALRNFWRYFTENGVSISIRCDLVSSIVDEPNGVTGLRRYLSSEDCDLHHESDADEGTDSEDERGADGTSNKPSVKDRLFVRRIIAAGHRARVGGGYLPIWVDALCINQGDPAEKNKQIHMMQEIFTKAGCVFSWLGPSGHNNLDLALSAIRKLAVRVRDGYSISQLNQDYPELCAMHSDLPPFNKYWQAISNFAEAEYFERSWIFQELWAAADSDETIFLCGDEHLPMGSLTRYRAWADSLLTQRSDDTPLFGRFIPIFPLITQIYGMKAGRENAVGATRLFLDIVRRSRCKNPRDKVFALFRIFRMGLTPDYTMPVADVYAAWASDSSQDLPLGSLIFYSGIGLYPRTLGTHNLASWQPDFERLGDQTSWCDAVYAYRHSDAGTPAKYKPTISPTRYLTCFGVQVTKVGKVASQAGKKIVDYTNVTRGMIMDYALNSTSMILLLKYLVDNKGRFWTHAYHERGSPLHALVETVNECTHGGDPPTLGLLGDTLREFTPYNLFMKALTVRDGPSNFTVDELKFLGFQSEEKLWECLAGMSSNPKDDDGFNPATEPSEGQENALLGFVSRLLNFSFNKNLFHTVDGRVGGGPPGTETHDLVYLIHGCSLPVLLREVEGKLRHVGVCYIPGLSGVDVFRILKESESDVRELSLV
ncbi:heterokaryon incompatibility protein-domain-containing protein [Chaetomidium leptoderma]|uniref:Heterokaryon incompatibility protein-domain-containing protein n=1 Tax=Chaetomidium leptoderma TaxID=669021 RepID=A0AAN6VEU0_9PEZI|nr:heterokaryon incompatibility protein-domain-containing protein [Chaetomidium leptoderma]